MDGQLKGRGQAALIYILPALLDMALSLVLFVGTVRVVKLGGDATRAASVLAVWSIVYVATSPLIGKLVNSGNARRFILGGCLLFALSSGLLAAATGYAAMLALVGVCAVATACFFTPFQVFMKDVDSVGGRSVAYSTGLYTFSWSTGFACGPFVAGFLLQLGKPVTGGGEGPGWRYAFLFGAAVCLLMPLVLAFVSDDRKRRPAAASTTPPLTADARYSSFPDLAWLGWIGTVAGMAALSIIRVIFPARAMGNLHLAESTLGSIFFVLSMTQALLGLALMRSRFWMYRALPVAAFAVSGIIGMLCLGFGNSMVMLLSGAVLFGLYSGAFCFYMVFHALVHPKRAGRYVAVNESLVGITSFLAPLCGGAMADAWGFHFPYLAAALLTLAVLTVQVLVHGKTRPEICVQ